MKIRAASTWVVLLAGMAAAQSSLVPNPAAPSVESEKPTLIIPAGTRVPLSLKQAISTKTAKTEIRYTRRLPFRLCSTSGS